MLNISDTPISTVNACLFLQFKSGRNVLTTSSTAILCSTDTAWMRVSLILLLQQCPDFRSRSLKTAMPNQLRLYWDAQQHTSTSLTSHSSTSAQVHTYLKSLWGGRGLCGNPRLHSLTEAATGETYNTECYQCQIITEFNRMAGISEHPDYHSATAHVQSVCPCTHTSAKSCPACIFPSAPTLTSQGVLEVRESRPVSPQGFLNLMWL